MNQVVNKRRHRIILDVTFKYGCTYTQGIDVLMSLFDNVDLNLPNRVGTQVQIVRPMDYRKVLTTAARFENEQIKANLEMAMDAIREAKNQL